MLLKIEHADGSFALFHGLSEIHVTPRRIHQWFALKPDDNAPEPEIAMISPSGETGAKAIVEHNLVGPNGYDDQGRKPVAYLYAWTPKGQVESYAFERGYICTEEGKTVEMLR
jgi:hypothetical protein